MNTFLERLNHGLHEALETDERVYLLGEDILDPYGGAFKVTRGLSTRFPDRVLTTPISESGIVGIASGMALRGLRPIVEIMFGDFLTLTADQIINHASKFRWMYNDQVRVPMVIRSPMGGRRGYGPTHSQSLEKLFLGVPGLSVVAPNTLFDPADLLLTAVSEDNPTLFIEHKLLYTCQMLHSGMEDLEDVTIESDQTPYPTFIIQNRYAHPTADITIATYGYNFELVRKAAVELIIEREIFCDIILFSQLSPFNISPLLASLDQTKRLLTVEEGGLTLGWAAEIAARVAEEKEDVRISRVAALDLPIANARLLEDAILPSVESILSAGIDLCAS